MIRYLGCCVALFLLAAPGRAQDEPERLLSPTTQLFIRWDGVTAHQEAYQGSAWGSVMSGPTGDAVRTLIARGPKLLGAQLLADPLLDGKPPEELRAVHTDLRLAEKLIGLVADKGVIVAAEVTEPRPTLSGLGKAVGGLIGGSGPSMEAFLPDARLHIVVPDVGEKSESLFAGIRLLLRQANQPVDPLPATLGRKGFTLSYKDGGPPVHVAWWVEARHFVFYVGTAPVETALKSVQANAAKGGVTGHPLFQRCLKTGTFESVARGYVDTGAVVNLAKRLAGPFVPGLATKVDAIGIGNLTAVVFTSGFQGKESKALYEFDLPGERKGVARLLGRQPLTLADLPPLPPDVSRFSALRVDFTAAYDAGLTTLDSLISESFGVEDQGKTPAEISRLRKEYLERELTKAAGINIREDLLPYLGDKIVLYQTPTEGLSVLGSVVCVSVKDPVKVRNATDRLTRALETVVGGPMKVRKKVLRGVEVREIYTREFGVVTPTYAVVGDWLVIAGHPQPVQGIILRDKKELDRWQPDDATAARLAQMPSDAIGLQYCHPKSVAHNLCCIGPLFLSTISRFARQGNESEFNPIDVGLIPNGHELGKHLFPNLTYTRDDGKTVRIEVNESFSIPLEFIGLEPFAFSLLTGLAG